MLLQAVAAFTPYAGAVFGSVVTQFFNYVVIYGRIKEMRAEFSTRLDTVEEKLDDIGEFKVKGGK